MKDPTKPAPLYWKLPGGHGNPGEFAELVAVREVEHETAVTLKAEDLLLWDKDDRGSHIISFFVARLGTLGGIKGQSAEGLNVRVFEAEEILSLTDFFPPHRKIFESVIKSAFVGRAPSTFE